MFIWLVNVSGNKPVFIIAAGNYMHVGTWQGQYGVGCNAGVKISLACMKTIINLNKTLKETL